MRPDLPPDGPDLFEPDASGPPWPFLDHLDQLLDAPGDDALIR